MVCGLDSVGICLDCRRAVCGGHHLISAGLMCPDCVAVRSERARSEGERRAAAMQAAEARAAEGRRILSAELAQCRSAGALMRILESHDGFVAREEYVSAWKRVLKGPGLAPSHDLVTVRSRENFLVKSEGDAGRWSESSRRPGWFASISSDGANSSSSGLQGIDAAGQWFWVTHNDGWLRFRSRNGTYATHDVLLAGGAEVRIEKIGVGRTRSRKPRSARNHPIATCS
jgi:hypothetical protein